MHLKRQLAKVGRDVRANHVAARALKAPDKLGGQRTGLLLHIGRNKAGSTTLQAYFQQNAAWLRAAGVDYVLFSQPGPPDDSLPSFTTHRDIADFTRVRAGRSVLVSHEGLCCFPLDLTRIMATDFAELDTQVIFYVRPYGEWVLSSYSFDVRTGCNAGDIDTYLSGISSGISFWPMLDIWGETLGWDRIRVRSLHPADLKNGDLLSDCLAAVGLHPAPEPLTERANVSPSWWVIEMLRLVTQPGPAMGWTQAGRAVAEELHRLTDLAAARAGLPCPPARYLSASQTQSLATLYNRDLARLAEKTGTHLQLDRPDRSGERFFVPSARHLPQPLIHMIRALATEAENARLHPEAAAFVLSDSFQQLCDAG